jgi:ectoine hydroxylase-related dioxygenase (phytanoyl-CoA dioxygenase family)
MTTTKYELTDEELTLLPSAADVRSYAAHGWYLSKKLFSDNEIDELQAASDAFYRGHRDRVLPGRPPSLAYWAPEDGPIMRHHDYVHYESDAIARILRKPLLGAVAARLAVANEIRVWQATMIYKPPVADEPTNVVPWHFDRHYWQTCTSDRMLTAFIPFHDCTEEMGTITMVDGSHLWREIGYDDSTTQHFANRDPSDLDVLLEENAKYNGTTIEKVPVAIPKGHVSFHHCKIYHGSGPNRSTAPRRAISLHLQDGGNQYRAYRRSDGSLVQYNHDSLLRETAEGVPDYTDPDYCPVLWG